MSRGYSAAEVSSLVGMPVPRIQSLVRAGVLAPERDEIGEPRFSFQDLAILRRAQGLVDERIPARKVVRALSRLRAQLGGARPLTGVQIAVDGGRIVAQDGGARWHAESGQALLPFETVRGGEPGAGQLLAIGGEETPSRAVAADGAPRAAERAIEGHVSEADPTADDYYQLGCEQEDGAPGEAITAYLHAVAADPHHTDAHVNLGRLLHQAGELCAAESHYRLALAARDDATAAFNLGVVLEDLGRPPDARRAYNRALALDPRNADAHYNLARLCERLGEPTAALRHLREYRELTKK